MNALWALGFCSCAIALGITPVIRVIFQRLGFVDRPDDARKLHARAVPRIGGLAIAISYIAAFALLVIFRSHGTGGIVKDNLSLTLKLLPAAAAIFITGLLDDLIGLKPWQKLAGQFAAAGWAYWAGIRILAIADHSAHWWSLPLSILWLVACSNAFNLIDGLDGLAAGVGLFATSAVVLVALMQKNVSLAIATVPLAGALLGFLRYNFNPASIFLGDCGSLLTGFLLGCFGVIWSQKCATILGMAAPLMAMALPVLDVTLSVIRRFLRHQPIFSGDRGHIHHRLLALGLKPKNVALVLYGVCGLAAAMSLLAVANTSFEGVVVVFFCAMLAFGVHRLKYIEFGVAQQLFAGGELRRLLMARIRLKTFQDSILRARTAEECWPELKNACHDLGFSRVKYHVFGREFEQAWEHSVRVDNWNVQISLSDHEYVNISYPLHSSVSAMIVVPFMEVVREQFRSKQVDDPAPGRDRKFPDSLAARQAAAS